MAKVFDQFHFSLIERDQLDLLVAPLEREKWLRYQFSKQFSFRHHGTEFFWVPWQVSDEFIVGVTERQKAQSQRTPPEEGGREFEGHVWMGAMVVIDPMHRPDGQKAVVEDHVSVGQPKAILSSLVAHINALPAQQYALYFKPLFRGDSFWRFAAKHGGRLEYVAFKFTVPNMIFNAGGGIKKGLQRIGNDTNAQEIEVKIESDDGVLADSKSVKEGIAYGEEGNARVTAKSLDGDYWSSTKRKLTSRVDDVLDFAKAKSEEIRVWLQQALDRDSVNDDSRTDIPVRDDDDS